MFPYQPPYTSISVFFPEYNNNNKNPPSNQGRRKFLRGTTRITFPTHNSVIRTSLFCSNGQTRRRLLDSPTRFPCSYHIMGDRRVQTSGIPANTLKGFHLALPSRWRDDLLLLPKPLAVHYNPKVTGYHLFQSLIKK